MKQNIFRAVMALLSIFAVLITGCKSYEPSPIDWHEVSSVWRESLSQAELGLNESIQFALALNPDINRLRLKKLASERYAFSSGWWNDPSLGFDAMRILDNGSHPVLGGLGFTFTLPVNGVPKLQKLAAERYSDADRYAVMVAERDLDMNVVLSWVALTYAGERIKLMEQTLEDHLAFAVIVTDLVNSGEMSKSVGDRLSLERLQRRYALELEKQRMEESRSSLLCLMGLHPDVDIKLNFSLAELNGRDEPAGLTNDFQLLKHPSVQEQLSRLDASELELESQIRRQYPDIEIGPRYENEDGKDRLGIEAGLSLPLWNRNRQGIASAEGGRDSQRNAAVSSWMFLVQRSRKLQLAAENARNRVVLLEKERIPATETIALRMEKLFKQGESDISDLLEAQHSLFDIRIELLKAKEELLINLVEVNYLVQITEESI